MALFSVLNRTTDGLPLVWFLYTLWLVMFTAFYLLLSLHTAYLCSYLTTCISQSTDDTYIVSRASSNDPISHWVELVKSLYTTLTQVNRHIYTNLLMWKYSIPWQMNGNVLLHQTSSHCLVVWCNLTHCWFEWLVSPWPQLV